MPVPEAEMETLSVASEEPKQEEEEEEKPTKQDGQPQEQILKAGPNAQDISPEKDGGILKEILKEGIGTETPSNGDKVKVHYVGKLTDGTQFDSSRDRAEEFEFDLGKGSVIKGWDVGVATMKKGEVALLYCASKYAYGDNGSPPKIPPDATLVFEVELISWQGQDITEDKDGGIIRRRVTSGEGYSKPNEGALVTVHLIGRYEERVFEERDVTFNLGDGCDHNIVEGVELALSKAKKGECSVLKLAPKYAFGDAGKPDANIPPNAEVEYELTLLNFEKAKESWELDSKEKLEQANCFKTKGTNYFKAGKYALAVKQYQKIITFIENCTGLEAEDEKLQQQLMLAGHLNLAMAYLKMNDCLLAEKSCDKALEIEATNEKGLFRRGMARIGLNELDSAKDDFNAVLKVDPSNKAAANQIIICNNKLKEQRDKEKKIYGNMFAKFASQDTKKNARKASDVLQNPGTWGEEDSYFRNKVDAQGDAKPEPEKLDHDAKEKFIEDCNLENVEMIP